MELMILGDELLLVHKAKPCEVFVCYRLVLYSLLSLLKVLQLQLIARLFTQYCPIMLHY